MSTLRIPASWMRGGTSKGLFFVADDLPADAVRRDALLRRAIGSPDPYGKQIDGVGGASSSTSKVVLVSRSSHADCDVDYLFGQVPVGDGPIDWSGNCGNLTAAVGPFAITRGLLPAPHDGVATVRIWQANIGKRIDAQVQVAHGAVVEAGDFMLDGVAFPGVPIRLDFLDPAGGRRGLLPAGQAAVMLAVPGLGGVEASLIDAGNPLVLVRGDALGVDLAAAPVALNQDAGLLARCEAVRVAGAIAMGLVTDAAAAAARPHTPKLALLGTPVDYVAAAGRTVAVRDHDVAVRVLSMGVFHHAIPGTAAIAIAAANVIPGTIVDALVGAPGGLRIGHASGVTAIEVELESACARGDDSVTARAGEVLPVIRRATLHRSARLLMEGVVSVPLHDDQHDA